MYPLTDEQRATRDLARTFAQREVAPVAQAIDERDEFPRELVRRMHELGLVGMCLPEQYGGIGAYHVSYLLAVEEIAVASAVLANINMVQKCYSELLARHATDAVRARWVPEIAAGRKIVAVALTEPHCGSDAAAIRTAARRDGGHYVVSGQKQFVTMGGVCDAAVVFARTDPAGGHRGVSAFLVEADRCGFTRQPKERLLGMRGEETAGLALDEVRVPAENLIGAEGEGFRLAMGSFDTGRIVIGTLALGIARAAMEAAADHARRREAFGRPIGEFEGVSFPLADMWSRLVGARLVLHLAAAKKDRGEPFTVEAAMGKLLASDLAMDAATDAVQIFGGMGYTMDLPVQRYLRDAKLTQIYEGTNQIQRLVISRALLRGQAER